MKRRKSKPINAPPIAEATQFDKMIAELDDAIEGTFPPGEPDELLASAAEIDKRIAERLREIERARISDVEFDMMLERLERERPTTVRGQPGRPSKATEGVVAALCVALSRPLPKALAATLVGINRSTLYDWERAGNEVSQRLARARARGVLYLHLKSLTGGKGSRVAQWMLERMFPEDYALHARAYNSTR